MVRTNIPIKEFIENFTCIDNKGFLFKNKENKRVVLVFETKEYAIVEYI